MSFSRKGASAYAAVAELRRPREQEADVFRRANGALRGSLSRGGNDRIRAIADNRRLWITLSDLMRDPDNALPKELRAGIVSLSLAVQREMDLAQPDFTFLIHVNDSMTAGLSSGA